MAEDSDAAVNSMFAADISRKMQVPDRILVSGNNPDSPTNRFRQPTMPSWAKESNDGAGSRMQVPDRILLAGNNAHVAAKSTPRELQLENSVLPTSPEHVRVYTPPRSIRLDDDSAFPTANLGEISDDEHMAQHVNGASQRMPPMSINNRPSSSAGKDQLSSSLGKDMSFTISGAEVAVRENMTPFEELQLVRRQIAKLNHRLMAVELENQQQQQREMIFTIMVSAYFFGKFIWWINRTN